MMEKTDTLCELHVFVGTMMYDGEDRHFVGTMMYDGEDRHFV